MKVFDIKNHHAYLLVGYDEALSWLLKELQNEGMRTIGNPDFLLKTTETFSVEDARDVKDFQSQTATENHKIIIILTKYFSYPAQHSLLKVLEEPTSKTRFFIITPTTSVLLNTLKSRLLIIDQSEYLEDKDLNKMAITFLTSEKEERLSIVSKIIKQFDKEETSIPFKVYGVAFLNTLEMEISKGEDKNKFNLEMLWKVKDYINDQGSSVKNLLETLALTI